MATVDLEKLKQEAEDRITENKLMTVWPEQVLALIRRVEQLEAAREEAETLCKGIEVGWHRSTLSQMISMSRKRAEKWMEKYGNEALKEETDSARGERPIDILGDQTKRTQAGKFPSGNKEETTSVGPFFGGFQRKPDDG